MRWFSRKTGFQIGLHSCDWGIRIYHWGPIIVNSHAKVGKNLTISPCCTIGRVGNFYPIIGDNCTLCQGAKVVGNVHVGRNVTIANNSVVAKDVADNCIVGGIPAKIIKEL